MRWLTVRRELSRKTGMITVPSIQWIPVEQKLSIIMFVRTDYILFVRQEGKAETTGRMRGAVQEKLS